MYTRTSTLGRKIAQRTSAKNGVVLNGRFPVTHQKKRTDRGTNRVRSKNQMPMSCVSIDMCMLDFQITHIDYHMSEELSRDIFKKVAVGEGFEPPVVLRPHYISG